MKKFLVYVMLILSVFSLTACKPKEVDKLSESISYSHEKSFVGENEDFTAIIEVGNKEEVFVDDGKVGNIVPFSKITIIAKTKYNGDSVAVKYLSEEKEVSEEIKKDMFTTNFENSVKSYLDLKDITVNNRVIELKDVVKECINRDAVMKVIKTELNEQIQSGYKDNEFTKELYIKLVRDNNNIKGELYWYVALIDGKNSFSSLLIDAKTGKVLNKKLAQ